MKKPNIIIINPDEMRWDTMGHMGNKAAYTPNLDSFAATQAVSFSRAYCQNPVCVPSRCSFFTGLYPHTHGHRTMTYLLHEGEGSLFTALKSAGYHVWMNARNDLAAGQIPGLVESHADEIFYGHENKDNANSGKKSSGIGAQRHEPGFPFSHYMGPVRADDGTDQDIVDTLAAIDRINKPLPEDKPLCIFLGWINPHPPYFVEKRFYDLIDESIMPERIPLNETRGKSEIIHRIHELVEMNDYSEEKWTDMRKVYLAQCAKVDWMFGQVCDALKAAGMYEDSAIFFLSDHGDFVGDYDLPEKAQNTFEDCLTRVPLLIKPPQGEKLDPGVSDSLVELIDFYATALDYAGAESEHDHFGISLREVVGDRSKAVRDFVCSEGGRLPHEIQADEYHASNPDGRELITEYWPKMKAQTDPVAHEKGTMYFDGQYKLIERPYGQKELYDMMNDPQEKINIYEEMKDSPVLMKIQRKLLTWYQTTCDIVPRAIDSRLTADKLWFMVRRMIPKENQEVIRKRIYDDPNVNIWQLMSELRQNR